MIYFRPATGGIAWLKTKGKVYRLVDATEGSISSWKNLRGAQMMKGDRYVKVVEWSDEDNCFIGKWPSLFYGGCHSDDATKLFIELCQIVEEAIETLEAAGKPLPQPLSLPELGAVLQRSA